MVLLSFTFLSLTLRFSLILANSPLLLGLWILLLATTISILIGLISSSWLGFFIFLIYIGGLLVIFAYFVALSPNQLFYTTIIFGLSILTLPRVYLASLPSNALSNLDFNSLQVSIPITSLLTNQNISIYLFLAIVLFLALVAVVKISTISAGPLRPFNYDKTYSKISPSYHYC